MPIRQQPDQQPLDEILLADDDLADLADQHPYKFAFAFNLFVNCANSLFHYSFLLRFTAQKLTFLTRAVATTFNSSRWVKSLRGSGLEGSPLGSNSGGARVSNAPDAIPSVVDDDERSLTID